MKVAGRRIARVLRYVVVLALAGAAGVAPALADTALERAVALQNAGRHDLALSALERSDARRASPGLVEGLRGRSLLALGRYDAAAAAFRRSIVAARADADTATAVRSAVNLAVAQDAGRDAAAALSTLEIAFADAERAALSTLALLAATNGVVIAGDAEGEAGAATWRSRALEAERTAPLDATNARTRTRLAEALLAHGGERGHVDTALLLERIAASAPDATTAARARGVGASLAERRGDIADAAARWDEAAFLAAGADASALRARAQLRAARAQAALGHASALEAYRQTLATVIALRQGGAPLTDDAGAPWPLDVEAAFREFLALLLAAADRAPATERALFLDEVRTTIERLRSFELERYFADDCVARLQETARAVEAVAPRTAVYYLLLTPEQAYGLLSLGGRLEHRRLTVDRARLEATALAFRRSVENRASHAFARNGQRLYGWLVAPWRTRLEAANVDTIVFIGDGAVRNVPLAALLDDDRFLVEDYAVATVPGLSLFDPRPVGGTELSFLLAALSEPVQGFPALPHTAVEVAEIADLFGGTVLRDEAFNEPGLARVVQRNLFSVVHIASHGLFESSGDESFILTHDGRLDLDDLDALLRVTRFRETPIELLTLSACQTAAGDERAALGLAGIAVKAGARSAVASLWSVNDVSAAELVTAFYRELAGGDTSRAEALRQAQLGQLRSARFRHPAYWAPFIVIGNWL